MRACNPNARTSQPMRGIRGFPKLLLVAGLVPGLFAQNAKWTEQGPGPIINGQDEGLTNPNNPVSGAVNAFATVSGDATTLYAGTVNGGIWKTTNATSTPPTWTPLTDTQLPALSIRSLAVSPLDNKLIFAGTGSSSSFGNRGSKGIGVARSTDGGSAWTVEAASTLAGAAIVSIVPTSSQGVVLAATIRKTTSGLRGLFRSTDNAKTFALLSTNSSSGLVEGGVSSIVVDPTKTSRIYAAIPDISSSSKTSDVGIYKSEDFGATWAKANGTVTVANSSVILLSVSAKDGAVYAMVIDNTNRNLTGIFFSADQGQNWKQMDSPSPDIFPGKQGGDQGAIVAHPTQAGIVFVSGDRQDNPSGFPNSNGCSNFTGNIFRGDTSKASGSQWENVVCSGANSTSPHADSRALFFTSDNTALLHGCDGGLFELTNPDTASTRKWVSLNGNARITEAHNVAFDPLSHILITGNQDTGTSYQSAVNSQTWTDIDQGDGAFVAVDADQVAHMGTSLRYESNPQLLGFARHSFDNANNFKGSATVALQITSGSGMGQKLTDFDTTLQFNNPFVLNNLTPARMLIGTSSIYESSDKGDSLNNLGTAGAAVTGMSYGSRLTDFTTGVSTDFADAFYVAAGKSILHRVNSANTPTVINSPGSNIVELVMNPQDYKNVYVVDDAGKVFGSTDEGVTWEDHTGDLANKISQPTTIEIFSPPPAKNDKRDKDLQIAVGGIGDVVSLHPKLHEKTWSSVGPGLPHAYFFEIHYNAACDTLVAGALGRGAWTITSPFNGGSSANCPALPAPGGAITQTAPPSTTPRPPKQDKPKKDGKG